MEFDAYCRWHAEVRALQVDGNTLGKTHTFTRKGLDRAVVLPGPAELQGTTGPVRREETIVGQEDDPDKTWFGVYSIAVLSSLPDKVQHDGDDDTFRSVDISQSAQGQNFRKTCPILLRDTQDYWLRVVRWMARSWLAELNKTGSRDLIFSDGFQVCRSSDSRLFDAMGGMAMATASTKISSDLWDQIQSVLNVGAEPPLWFDHINDADARLSNGDIGGAIVSGAIACETALRAIYWSGIPSMPHALASKSIDSVSAQSILANWADLAGVDRATVKAVGKSEVHQLFDMRNDVMHRGDKKLEESQEVGRVLNAARKFINHADTVYIKLTNKKRLDE